MKTTMTYTREDTVGYSPRYPVVLLGKTPNWGFGKPAQKGPIRKTCLLLANIWAQVWLWSGTIHLRVSLLMTSWSYSSFMHWVCLFLLRSTLKWDLWKYRTSEPQQCLSRSSIQVDFSFSLVLIRRWLGSFPLKVWFSPQSEFPLSCS